nr:hypothetical protein [Tanacetum cinerariifolium]
MVVLLPFTVNLYHDEAFHVNPFQYVNFHSKYKISSDPLTALKLIKNNEDLSSLVKACYKNNLKIDLFTKHSGYGIMETIDEELHPKKHVSHVDSDSDVETSHPLDDVAHVVEQFEHEDKSNVNIPRMTIDDSWLKKW